MMTIVNTYFRLPCNGMNCKYSDSGDFVAHCSSRNTSNRVTSVLATCFISLGTPAIIPKISTGSSLACNVWCCISLRPRNELVNEHRLTWFLLCCHIDRATSRPPRLLDTIPNLPQLRRINRRIHQRGSSRPINPARSLATMSWRISPFSSYASTSTSIQSHAIHMRLQSISGTAAQSKNSAQEYD